MKRTARRQSKRSRLNKAASNRARHAARKMTFENMEDRRLLATVVYDFTVDTPVGFGGTITLDLDFPPTSSNGTIDTYEWGNSALEDFSLSHPSYAGVTFDGTDAVSDFELTMATADDTPLTLFMDVDDTVNGFIFTEAEFNFGTGNGTLAGALAVTGAALTPQAQPAALITGVTAAARSEFHFHDTWHHQIEEAVNGDGMVSGEGATGLHTAGVGQNHGVGWQVAQPGNIAHWIKVDLGASYDVENMYVWNGLGGLWERGMKTADIYYSTTDPGNNTHTNQTDFNPSGWTLLTSGQAFAQTDNPTNADFLPSDTIALGVNARYIALDITEAYGGINNTSISELQFSGTEVVPAQWDYSVYDGNWDDGSSWLGGVVPTFAAGDTALVWYDNHAAAEGVLGSDQPWNLNPAVHDFGVELNSTVTLGTIQAGHDVPGSPLSESGEAGHWDNENFISHFYGTGKVIWDNNGAGALFDQSEMNFRDPLRAEWSIDMELADDLMMDIHTERHRRLSSTITESGGSHELEIWHNGNANPNDVKRLYISGDSPNTYSGGTTIDGDAYVELQKDGALGTGDVTIVDADAQLKITSSGGAEDRIDDSAGVYLLTGNTLILDSGVTETVDALYFDGAEQAGGTWGRTGLAGVDHNTDFITGDGVLTVPLTNTAPVITGTVAGQNVADNATIQPFSGVTIGDDDGDSLGLSVMLDVAANGTLSGGGFTETGVGTGVYTFSAADPAAATTAIQALTFTPTANQVAAGSTVTTTFTISVNDQTAPAVTDDTTTVIATAIDVVPPTVTSFALNTEFVDPADLPRGPQPTSWQQQRSDLRSIRVEFSKPIEILPSEVVLTNLGLNAPVDADVVISLAPAQVAVAGSTLTIVFGVDELPEGVYQLELLETITSVSGLPLDGDANGVGGDAYTIVGSAANSFTRLTTDWNGDSGVSVFDFSTFSYWFGQTIPTAPKYADVNDDSGVTVFDFTPFSTNFGEELIFSAAFAALIHDEGSLRAAGVFEESEPAEVIVRVPTGQGWEIEHRDRMTDAIMHSESEGFGELDWALDAIAADVAGLDLI